MTTRNHVYTMIANEDIYIVLGKAALKQPEFVRVFPDSATAEAYANVIEVPAVESIYAPKYIDLSTGGKIVWDGREWEILNAGDGVVSLLDSDKEYKEIPNAVFDKLISGGRITGVERQTEPSSHPKAVERMMMASKEHLEKAIFRAEVVRAILNGAPLPPMWTSPREPSESGLPSTGTPRRRGAAASPVSSPSPIRATGIANCLPASSI